MYMVYHNMQVRKSIGLAEAGLPNANSRANGRQHRPNVAKIRISIFMNLQIQKKAGRCYFKLLISTFKLARPTQIFETINNSKLK